MSIILKAENISKQYRLGLVGTGSLTHDINRWWHGIRGKEDPYLKVGAVNDRSVKASEDYVWALRNINFEVEEGEVLGIIGKNGAGKSTLLKLLSRVTSPTTGEIKTRGRIASLLEVGTGFHPELTGRENIFLNGAILGMTKSEIRSKLDEIIDFSGCEMYIDTPVKRYSSGMRVRLAFAVAAHLEPDILVVDEVLAVGDAEFQKKAIGKMQNISRGEGRTVLFVSHNMAAVKSLCTRAIVLEHGKTVFEGDTDEAVSFYLTINNNETIHHFINNKSGNLKSIEIKNENKNKNFVLGDKFYFLIKLNNPLGKFRIDIGVYDENEDKITNFSTSYSQNDYSIKDELYCNIEKIPFSPGKYFIHLAILDNKTTIEFYKNVLIINVLSGDFYKIGYVVDQVPSKLFINHIWE